MLYFDKKGVFTMKSLKTKISITLDSDMVTTLKELAEQDDRSLSQYINLIVKEHLKNQTISKKVKQDT